MWIDCLQSAADSRHNPLPSPPCAGDGGQVLTPKQLEDAVAREATLMYQKLSADVHNPGLEAVPIQVRFLGPNHAAMMIRCCEEAVVAYAIYDAGGVHVASPPPSVIPLPPSLPLQVHGRKCQQTRRGAHSLRFKRCQWGRARSGWGDWARDLSVAGRAGSPPQIVIHQEDMIHRTRPRQRVNRRPNTNRGRLDRQTKGSAPQSQNGECVNGGQSTIRKKGRERLGPQQASKKTKHKGIERSVIFGSLGSDAMRNGGSFLCLLSLARIFSRGQQGTGK